MLTPLERSLLPSMLQRSFAGDCLDLIKMRALVPVEVENAPTGYKAKIVEMVFDPMHIPRVNARFQSAGFLIPDEMNVIAVNSDGTVLVWESHVNCILWLRKGEPISEGWDDNLAFEDLRHLTRNFKIKNKKPEIDDMIAALKKAFAKK